MALGVVVQAGSTSDPQGHSGTAHLVEHLLFLDSKHLTRSRQDEVTSRLGLFFTANTAADATTYLLRGPSGTLEHLFWMVSDHLLFTIPTLTDETVKVASDVVANEGKQAHSTPEARAETKALALLYADSPYVGLTFEDVQNPDKEVAAAFIRDHYTADNVHLVILGDVAVEQARVIADKYLGSMPTRSSKQPAQVVGSVTPANGQKVTISDAFTGPVVVVAWKAPGFLSQEDAALDAAVELLAGDAGSLKAALVKQGLSKKAACARSTQASISDVTCIISLNRIEDSDAALATLDASIAALDHAEPRRFLAVAKLLKKRLLSSLGPVRTQLQALTSCVQTVGKADCIGDILAQYRALTAERVSLVVKKWLAPDARVVVLGIPQKREP